MGLSANRTGRRISPFFVWLPGRIKTRTNSLKSVWERVAYYSRTQHKGILIVRGQRPRELGRISKISARRWKQYENDCRRENPIIKAMRFLRVFEQETVRTYAQAAEILGVSRQRVYQLTWLVTKLPEQIKDFLVTCEEPTVLRHFTERRLRPLLALKSDEEKLVQFTDMLESVCPGEPSRLLPVSDSRQARLSLTV